MKQILIWGVLAGMLITYAVVRLVGVPAGTIGTLGFATFAAIEFVAVVWHAAGPHRRSPLILAHALNAIGASLLSYSSLQDDALIPNLIGTPFFVVGMALWARHARTHPVSLSDESRQARPE